MRILAVTHQLDRSGAPMALLRVLATLVPEHAVTVLSLRGRGPLADDCDALGIPVVEEARPADFDVALCNTVVTSQRVVWAAREIPVIWWIHEGMFGLDLLKLPHNDLGAFRAARRVVFPTAWQAREVYAPLLDGVRWDAVPMGVPELPSGHPPVFDRREGEFVLLQVGTVEPRKGPQLTVEAVRRLGDPGIRVIFLGDVLPGFDAGIRPGEEERFLRVGSVPPAIVTACMEQCDALVLPTFDDLIPLVVLEAMSLGTCVLTSDFGPIPEAVGHGYTGLLSPVGDHRVLAGNIAMIRRDPLLRATLGLNGRRLCLDRHGFDAHAAGMRRIIEQAVQ